MSNVLAHVANRLSSCHIIKR